MACMPPSTRITSRHNPRVKAAAELRDRRARERSGCFLIDGGREITRALESGIRPREAFVCETHSDAPAAQEILQRLERAGAEIFPVTVEVFERICFGDRDDVGIVLVAETPLRKLADIQLPPEPLVAVLE